MANQKGLAPEIQALNDVVLALANLDDAEKTWVLQTAASRFKIEVEPQNNDRGVAGGSRTGTTGSGRGADGIDPKQFMREKNPQTDVERAACLAYYLTHHRSTQHFKSREIAALNTEAAGPKINMARAVDKATNPNHYLAPAGGGKKQITSHGEEMVEALPDRDKVNELKVTRPKRKNSARKKTTKTKKAKRG